jgi:tRNA(Ile)-lysidine synthase
VGGKAAGWHEQEQGCEAWLTLDIKYFSLGDDK